MSQSTRTTLPSSNHTEEKTNTMCTGENAIKESGRSLLPQSRGDPKTGIPRRRYADEQDAPNMDEMAGYIMDKTLKFNLMKWLKEQLREEKCKRREQKRELDSRPSSAAPANKDKLPSATPASRETDAVPFPRNDGGKCAVGVHPPKVITPSPKDLGEDCGGDKDFAGRKNNAEDDPPDSESRELQMSEAEA
ncbi:hypothetical protein GLOTRDRAFT_93224 [Gloeophyllum trabeum ATCC 11539]|uniref:Uncharacterized protein n=1 Tax=Gloeophyllum trabeum (strain ATCC 11539 / FP-39264 / Madison 617) TaxID=670483 RepID=S7Q7W8_GLOTA|nr:uncharacterized protein GLOTRDRAFT_93224 [Gloeophyllum trabeum ATCC 11539]EPQ55627.1 hypothetical protein GLOTRDRAFT_93224 [Gloeophyllum trabeum ATCC 11539]